MSDLANGILVRHVSLGVGKVVALEPFAVHVFFPAAEKRFATKLRLPDAHALLRRDGIEPDAWLQGLSAFTLDPETRRYALAASWMTHEQAVAQFLAARPGGFEEPAGTRSRASVWRAASEAFGRTLLGGEGERLVRAGDDRELVKRALAVARLVAPVLSDEDAESLPEALAEPAQATLFFERLFELVAVPSPSRARFDRLFAAATTLASQPEAAWILATLFPFLAQPERQAFLHPRTARDAARRLGCDLRWEDAPNWATYSAFRTFALKLVEKLAPMGARDLVDVDTFLYEIAAGRAKGKGKAKPKAAAAAPPQAPAKPAPRTKAAPKPAAKAKRAASGRGPSSATRRDAAREARPSRARARTSR
jgi:hypothetical protein